MRAAALALVAALSTVLSTIAVTMTATAPVAQALPDGLALTPPMGFNNWNSTHCRAEFNEAMVKGIADIFVARGLKDAGYQYVNLDDCWALRTRGADGNLRPDPVRFPNGIKAVADYVHSKGLKFGIYTSSGSRTCDGSGFPGAEGHEQQDANLFASWGVDYLKYDNCNHSPADAKVRYRAMRDALKNTGRPIVYAICEWGENRPWEWAADVGHLWRTTYDIDPSWSRSMWIYEQNVVLDRYAGPGRWNDPDMLEVGNGGMNTTEYRSQFSLWAMMAAPLLIGADLRKASADTFAVLSNADVIAIDQDRLGVQGKRIRSTGGIDVIVKPLANGDKAVALFNKNDAQASVSTSLAEVGMSAGTYNLKDVWSKANRTTTGSISATVPAHGTVVYRISRAGDPAAKQIVGASGRCVDVNGGGTADGTKVQLWTCSGGANQMWTRVGGTLQSLGKCLDVNGGSQSNGAVVQLWSCNGSPAQSWTVQTDGTLRNGTKCLDAFGGGTANGTPLVIWTCHGGTNQRWTFS